MSPLRNSIQSRCCCDVTDPLCYQLDECASSTGCAENGVFLSLLALQYLQETYGSFGAVILCLNDKCCLDYSFFTQYNEFTIAEVLEYDPLPSIIYAESEGQGGTPIEKVPECKDGCDSCADAPEGACCYLFRGSQQCEQKTQEECKVICDDGRTSDCHYHGDDTCCPPVGDCNCPSGDDNCIDSCSEDVPSCDLYCGLCVDTGGAYTWCSGSENDNNDSCPDSVSLSFNFPAIPWKNARGTNDDCESPDCGQGSQDSCCSSHGSAMGGSMQLFKEDNENKWSNRDNQHAHPTEERPDPAGDGFGGNWEYMAALDEQFRFGSCGSHSCPPAQCGNSGWCQKCYPSIPECQECMDESNFGCPCCCGQRWMSYWAQAEVWQTVGYGAGTCPYPTADHGSVCWEVRVRVCLMTSACVYPFGDEGCDCYYMNSYGCAPDTQNIPDATHATWSSNFGLGIYWKVQVPECGCPVSIGSGDAWSVSADVPDPDERCRGTCSCRRYVNMFGGLGDYDQYIGGASWGLS